MDINDMANELTQMHIDQAKALSQLENCLSTNGEIGVLLYLYQRKEDTFSIDIVEHFGLTPGRVANILKGLEKRGYLLREQALDDKRKAYLSLTREGMHYAQQLYRQLNEAYSKLLITLSEDDRIAAVRIIKNVLFCIE